MKPASLFPSETPTAQEETPTPAPVLFGDFDDPDLPSFVRWIIARAKYDPEAYVYLFAAELKDRHFHRVNGWLRHTASTTRWAHADATQTGKSHWTIRRPYARIVISLVHEGPGIFRCKVAVFKRD